MEHIKIAKVENVSVLHHGTPRPGTLHLTAHHLIFKQHTSPAPPQQHEASAPQLPPHEIWIAYPIIGGATRYSASAASPAHIRLRDRDFSFLQFRFQTDRECRDVFDSIRALSVVKGGVEKLYAYIYHPSPAERKFNGWAVYDAEREFRRQGVGTEQCKGWRFTKINQSYEFSPTYPATLVVPSSISDTTLGYAKQFRSRGRIPTLTYIHRLNNCTITRCAQPMTGVRGNRSIQDEKLVAAIFSSSQPGAFPTPPHLRSPSPLRSSGSPAPGNGEPTTAAALAPPGRVYGAQQHNLIVDARPTVNAYAMQMLGMGTEDMDKYMHTSEPPCTRIFLGIDNIHVMRESLQKVVEAIKDSDITPMPPNRELLQKSNWLKHIGLLLEGTATIVNRIAVEHAHVLLHCSDGWDRTSQLASLAQICLDPYFRTMEGFMVLVEKDWISFGHKFRDRSGILGHEKWFSERNSYASTAQEMDGVWDDDDDQGTPKRQNQGPAEGAAAFGQALVGQARNFFNAGQPSVEGDDTDLKIKAARAVEHPSTKPKEVSPMFHQFLDATYQLMLQYPTRFEYNERFLRRLLFHLYSCQYGNFLHNNDLERREGKVREKTHSVWTYFLSRRKMWLNETYDKTADSAGREREINGGRVLFPKLGPGAVKWWAPLWGREDSEMNGAPPAPPVTISTPNFTTTTTTTPRNFTPLRPTVDDDGADLELPPVQSPMPLPASALKPVAAMTHLAEGMKSLAMDLPMGTSLKWDRRSGSEEEQGTEMT